MKKFLMPMLLATMCNASAYADNQIDGKKELYVPKDGFVRDDGRALFVNHDDE